MAIISEVNKEEFEKRIREQKWDSDDDGDEWVKGGEEDFIEIGHTLNAHGLSYALILGILGRCYTAVRNEYGD